MKARGWQHPRSDPSKGSDPSKARQIEHQLAARLPRYPDTFRRVAPQTFALTANGPTHPPAAAVPLNLFRGPGTPVAAAIGDSDAAFTDGDTAWRSS